MACAAIATGPITTLRVSCVKQLRGNKLLATAQIIQVFDSAATEPTRTTITNAMKIYERDVLHDVTWHP